MEDKMNVVYHSTEEIAAEIMKLINAGSTMITIEDDRGGVGAWKITYDLNPYD